ncbi:Protoporphyrinogen oxidase [Stieleria neptunia]|uniref:Coproporphyrinogen III oxidase n=1 Tax=Stieleria neptunia TaxID=2527979 RepID=A0A518HNL1_9BACT|nr:protoporphyrinogen oxidase [Stieleria neptunia]QDV42436.1 Protoporphyrinogen oxidase [Stieleria neptunia]
MEDKSQPPSPSISKRIAVVGGGLSGLATAFYLKRFSPDASIKLYESSSRLGGVIDTERIETAEHGCFVIDHGADMFATEPPAAIELCRDLGVEDQLIVPDTTRAGAMIVHRGKLVPIPDGFVLMRATKLWQMVTTPLLSVPGKLRFLAERFVNRQPHANEATDDISVAEFVRHRMGEEVLDRLVGPLVAGIYTADIEKLSMNATMAPMVAMVQQHGSLAQATLARRRENQDRTERNSAGARYEKFRGFPDGMKQLIDTLAVAIGEESIQTDAPINALHLSDDQERPWEIHSDQGADSFDEVVLATPAAVSARLLSTVTGQAVQTACETAAEALSTIESASTAIVVLCVPTSQIARLPNQFGFVVPKIENRNILAVSFASHKYPIRCPDDHTIIRVFVGGALQSELLEQSDDEMVEMVRGELAELIGMTGKETLARVVRWNNAMPQYHVGHLKRVESIGRAVDQIPHLHLVSNALRGVGIAPVIAAGKAMARKISGAE